MLESGDPEGKPPDPPKDDDFVVLHESDSDSDGSQSDKESDDEIKIQPWSEFDGDKFEFKPDKSRVKHVWGDTGWPCWESTNDGTFWARPVRRADQTM